MIPRTAACIALAFACVATMVQGQDGQSFSAAQIKHGAQIYSQNCAPCHGPRMMGSQVPGNLRKFPPAEKSRFLASVVKGKNQMPPYGNLFKPEEIEALWDYVMAGEK